MNLEFGVFGVQVILPSLRISDTPYFQDFATIRKSNFIREVSSARFGLADANTAVGTNNVNISSCNGRRGMSRGKYEWPARMIAFDLACVISVMIMVPMIKRGMARITEK